MTGYVNRVVPENDSLVRLRLPGNYLNLIEFLQNMEIVFQYQQNLSSLPSSYFGIDEGTVITEDSSSSGLWRRLNATLDPPVSDSYLDASESIACPPGGNSQAWFTYLRFVNNKTYPWNYTESIENVRCIQGTGYQWGFSSVLTIIVLMCSDIWLLGIFITWRSLLLQSECKQKRRDMGIYWAAIDLAEVIREELGPHLSAWTNSAIETKLKKRPPVRYSVTLYFSVATTTQLDEKRQTFLVNMGAFT
ncbi:hypothetical protein MMC14_002571 [Varicellaria rhodocarpa]|nr:hypothetical protein [Varicellaria rhodocarpa]